ncbi:MAG TPA: TonB-dependent receptor [Longimicrobiales bacterium]
MLRKAVTKVALTLATAVMFVTLSVTNALAQGSTGRIQGRVTSNGQPVASAQVTVVGTSLGNITDAQGRYFINEVPAGLVTIRAASIGFRTTEVTNQRIIAGNTITQDFVLEQTAVELEALEIRGDRNPLVPRDQVSSRAIVTGETIDKLPMDNAQNIVKLQPGVISTGTGANDFSIRGSREGEEAVYVDGVPIRRIQNGTSNTIELPTNALAQLDVTTGGISARFGGAQSGVINYVTRTGGTSWSGSASFQTDQLSPKKLSQGFNRAELSIGGPVPFLNNLSYFGALAAEGYKYGTQLNQTLQDVYYPQYVPIGIDTVIRLARTNASGASGCSSGVGATCDSVDIVIPNFVDFDNGSKVPGRQDDEIVMTNRLTYGLGRGSKLDLSYFYNRGQTVTSSVTNPDNQNGSRGSTNMFTLGGYFLLNQSADRQIALDTRVSYMRDFNQGGTLDIGWLRDHEFPMFGFNFGNLDFAVDDLKDRFPVNDIQILARRSNLIPTHLDNVIPVVDNTPYAGLTARSGAAGLSQSLRLNPYLSRPSTQGLGNPTQSWSSTDRWYYTGSIDYQMTRFNRVQLGGEMSVEDDKSMAVGTTSGASNASHYTPRFGGLFVTNRLDIGDVVLEGGVRMDYFDPNAYFARVPGYVFNVPDSLKADAYTVVAGEEPFLDRVVPLEDCGGAATAAERTNAITGEVVCKNNFIATKKRTVFSPKLAVSFPVTASSTFRLSYGQNTQPPKLTGTGGILGQQLGDLTGGINTNASFGREVDIPRTVAFEAGYRQLFSGNTVVDVAAYSKTTRNALSNRKLPFVDPVDGAPIYLNVLVNADYSLIRGAEMKVDHRFSQIADLSLSYTFTDARGTGSDPSSYTGIFARSTSNVGVTFGTPVAAPDILLPLDQSRAHNIATILSVQLPSDYASGNSVANAILGDLGIFATGRLASGLPYTLLENQGNGQTGPPTAAGQEGTLAESLNASRTPMEKRFDLRLTKGFTVMGKSLRGFVDARNPFNIANTNAVWLETGQITNNLRRETVLKDAMADANLDGDILVDDFNILTENTENAVNKYMLLQAESRFGNGDGIFTVAEQRALYGESFDRGSGPQAFRNSPQLLRLGLEINF